MALFEKADREDYERALECFHTLVAATTAISQGSSGRPVESGRHYHASLLYTRLSGWGTSALLALPGNRLSVAEFENWDFPAVASLTRSLIECYLAFFYLCVEPVEKEDWECRWNIFNLHDCLRRRKFFALLGTEDATLEEYDRTADALRDRLRANPIFRALDPKTQRDCLGARKLYLQTQDELIEKIGIEHNFFRAIYEFFSSQVHTFPMGFFRIGEGNRGRGLENETDRTYVTTAVELSSFFLKRAAKEMIHLFPGADEGVSRKGQAAIYESDSEDET